MEKYKIENVTANTAEEMHQFLKRHEETTLFLQSNYRDCGYALTKKQNSGNYKIIRSEGNVVAVFALCRRGTLLIESEEGDTPIFQLILSACKQESIPLTGIIGEWSISSNLWSYLKDNNMIKEETFRSKEVLYSLVIDKYITSPHPDARLLCSQDFSQWIILRRAYIKEMQFPNNWDDELLKSEFEEKVQKKITWGVFDKDNTLLATADLNAICADIAQVGGVYTLPIHRGQGLSRGLMQKLIQDARDLHHIRKLVIFTGEDNLPAKMVYEALGSTKVGHYALLFGIPLKG